MGRLKSLWDILHKFRYILTPSHKRWAVVVIVLTVIGAFFEMLGVTVIIPLVQVMIDPEQLRGNLFLQPAIKIFRIESDGTLIWFVGICVISVYLIKNAFLLFLSYVRIKFACKVRRELSTEMMRSYMGRGYLFFVDTSTGELLRGMGEGILNTYQAIFQMFKLLAEVLTIMAICIYIVGSDLTMAVCVILLAGICLLMVILGFQKWAKRSGEIYYKYNAHVNAVLMQIFQGIKEVLVMHRQKYFVDEYEKNYSKQQKGTIGQTISTEAPAYIIEAVCVAGLIIAVCIKALNTENSADFVPQLASFAVAAFRILPSLGRISANFNTFMYSVPGVNDTYENFKEARRKKSDLSEEEDERAKESIKWQFHDRISVEHVLWKYPRMEKEVLHDCNLEIRKGQSVAFVGRSGAGKSTLADIILGLLTPQGGTVKIDGENVRDLLKSENHMIGFVPQSANLLDDTVRRNVAFGIRDEEIDDAKVWRALEQAQIKEIVEESPQGLDTVIGERGMRFSGGQRQRFAIARALYCDPDILIFDEATSALDTETETAVMESLESLQGHKTLIIIAHRLTTIRNCDVIYEIVDGKAVKREYEELV